MHLIVIYALTLEICIYTHYKSWPNVHKFSDRYTEPAEYVLYAKLKALLMTYFYE
jgi:hypothetical protein